MEELIKKLKAVKELIKALGAPAPITTGMPVIPPTPTIPAISIKKRSVKAPKIPGLKPGSKKDPKKVAEQLKAAQVQKLSMPVLKSETDVQPDLSHDFINTAGTNALRAINKISSAGYSLIIHKAPHGLDLKIYDQSTHTVVGSISSDEDQESDINIEKTKPGSNVSFHDINTIITEFRNYAAKAPNNDLEKALKVPLRLLV
jgi:hypothetical protein